MASVDVVVFGLGLISTAGSPTIRARKRKKKGNEWDGGTPPDEIDQRKSDHTHVDKKFNLQLSSKFSAEPAEHEPRFPIFIGKSDSTNLDTREFCSKKDAADAQHGVVQDSEGPID